MLEHRPTAIYLWSHHEHAYIRAANNLNYGEISSLMLIVLTSTGQRPYHSRRPKSQRFYPGEINEYECHRRSFHDRCYRHYLVRHDKQ